MGLQNSKHVFGQIIMKIAAISDIHIKKTDKGRLVELFQTVSENADVLLICGDLTDNGFLEEAQNIAEDAKSATIPILAVLGNHDYENNLQNEIKETLTISNISVLENESKKIKDVEFFGLKGYCGGFDQHMLASWGETSTKNFVNESVSDSLKLDSILSHSQENKKVVLMHYSPISQTVEGEPKEIYPFLGSSRYEEVINRRVVNVVFHGHAHKGTLQGKTKTDIPVFNVCHSLIYENLDQKKYFLYEI
jgi:Icc-related predicted phosphoesterase